MQSPYQPIESRRSPVFRRYPLTGRYLSLLIVSVFGVSLVPAFAGTTVVWDGGAATTNWLDAANWNPNAVNLSYNATFGNFRLNVNSGQQLVYDAGLGTTVYTGDTANNNRGLVIGNGANGSMSITGGSFGTTGATAPDVVGNGGASLGVLSIDGGAFVGTAAGLSLGIGSGGNGVLTINSGSATVTTLTLNATSSTVNLNGGTLTVGALNRVGGSSTVNFNGGTLRASADFTSTTGATGNVQAGGAVFDTNGNAVTIGMALLNAGAGGITKNGAGTLTLSGTNTYIGTTTVNDGTLALSGGAAIADAGAVVLANTAGAGLLLNADETIGSLAGGGAAGGNVNLQSFTLTTGGNGTSTAYAGSISGTGGLAKNGSGTMILNGAAVNTFTGGLTVNQGTLNLDFANLGTPIDLINSGNTLSLGAGTLQLTGKGGVPTTSQTFTGTVLNSGKSTVALSLGAGATSTTLDLGAITHSTGGALNILPATSGSLIVKTSTANNAVTNGIIGPWLTVGSGSTMGWGQKNGSGNIVAYVGAGGVAPSGWTTNGTENRILTGGPYTLAAPAWINTLNMGGTNNPQTLSTSGNTANTFTVSGLMATHTTGAAVISGAAAVIAGAAGSNYELFINGSSPMTISAPIINNGANSSAVSYSGSSTLTLSGANTYSGQTAVNAGIVQVASNSALGTTAAGTIVYDGAQLELAGNVTITGESVTINGTGGNTFGALQNASGTNIWDGPVVIGSNASGIGANTGTLTVSGAIADGGGSDMVFRNNTGTLILSGNNIFTGTADVLAGVTRVSHNNALGTVAGGTTVASGARLELAGDVTVTGETLTVNGTGGNFFGALQNQSGSNTWAGPVVIGDGATRIGAESGTLTVSGAIANGGGSNLVVRNNTGTTVLSGANAYTGATTVAGGTTQLAGGNDRLPVGTTLQLGLNLVTSTVFDLNGRNQQVAAITVAGGSSGNVITSSSGTPTLTVNNGASDTYAGVLSGSLRLTKNGAGTLTLSGANTYSGITTVNAGTLALSGGAAIADAGAVVLANTAGAGLQLNASETIGSLAGGGAAGGNVNLQSFSLTTGGNGTTTAYAGAISGTGGLTKNGAGAMTLSGNNSYDGVTGITNGILVAASSTALGSTVGATTVTNGARLALAGDITITGEQVTVNGAGGNFWGGLQNQSGSNTWTGAVRIGDSTARIGSEVGSLTVSGVISGSGSNNLTVRNESGATTILSGVNTYTGTTTFAGGTTKLDGGDNRLPVGTSLQMGLATVTSTVFDLNGQNQQVAAVTEAGSSSGNVVTSTIGTPTLTINNSGADTYNGVLAGSLGLTKSSGGTLTLGGANTYAGPTIVNAGILQVGSNQALGTAAGGVSVVSGARVELLSGVTVTGESVTINGTGGNNYGALQNVSGNSTWAGPVVIGSNGARLGSNSGSLTISGSIADGGGTAPAFRSNTGTLILSGNNTFTGAASIPAGITRITSATALGAAGGGITIANDGRLELAGNITVSGETATITGDGGTNNFGALQNHSGNNEWAGPVLLNSGNTRIGANAGTLTVSGAIGNGTGNTLIVRNNTNGTVVLSGANTYSGSTQLAGGITQLAGGDNRLPIGTVLQMGLSGVGTTVLDLNGQNQEVAGLATAGTDRTITSTAGTPTLTVNNSSARSYDGVLAGSLGLTKTGVGTLTLSGTNTYSGLTNINGGTLAVAGGAAIPDAGAVVLANTAGARLLLNNDEAVGSVAGGGPAGGTVSIQGNTLTTGGDNSSTTLSGLFSGTGQLTKIGNGTMTMDDASGFSGRYQVDSGALAVANVAMGTPNAIHIANGATFDTRSTVFSPAAPVTISGNGTLDTNGAGVAWNSNLTFTPGNSPGQLDIVGNVDWSTAVTPGGTYNWEVYDANGGAGGLAGYDLINITGTLDMTGGSGTINGIGLSGLPNVAGLPLNVDMEPGAQTLFEIIRTSAGVIGFGSFSPTFVNSMNHRGFFKLLLGNGGNSVYLLWEATPEPGTWVLLACLLGAGLVLRRRATRSVA